MTSDQDPRVFPFHCAPLSSPAKPTLMKFCRRTTVFLERGVYIPAKNLNMLKVVAYLDNSQNEGIFYLI